jgi:hypothetical protein
MSLAMDALLSKNANLATLTIISRMEPIIVSN